MIGVIERIFKKFSGSYSLEDINALLVKNNVEIKSWEDDPKQDVRNAFAVAYVSGDDKNTIYIVEHNYDHLTDNQKKYVHLHELGHILSKRANYKTHAYFKEFFLEYKVGTPIAMIDIHKRITFDHMRYLEEMMADSIAKHLLSEFNISEVSMFRSRWIEYRMFHMDDLRVIEKDSKSILETLKR